MYIYDFFLSLLYFTFFHKTFSVINYLFYFNAIHLSCRLFVMQINLIDFNM